MSSLAMQPFRAALGRVCLRTSPQFDSVACLGKLVILLIPEHAVDDWGKALPTPGGALPSIPLSFSLAQVSRPLE